MEIPEIIQFIRKDWTNALDTYIKTRNVFNLSFRFHLGLCHYMTYRSIYEITGERIEELNYPIAVICRFPHAYYKKDRGICETHTYEENVNSLSLRLELIGKLERWFRENSNEYK